MAANSVVITLGDANGYGVLAGQAVTSTGPTIIKGNLGLTPGSSVTGFPPGTVTGVQNVGNASAISAQSALTTAYNQAAGLTPNVTYAGVKDLAGLTLAPGVYKSGSQFLLNGTLVLDAHGNPNAGWVFQTGSSLTTGSGSKVLLINGAQACNVFWQVTSSATLGTSSTFNGTILALTSTTLNTGVVMNGEDLARNGSVTLDSVVITVPVCMTNGNGGSEIIVIPVQNFTEFARTPNEFKAATALNSFRINPTQDQLAVLTSLSLVPDAQGPAALESVMPTAYQSLGTIAFNLANAQNMELAQRLWGQRVAGSGFSMSGLPENTPIWDQGKNVVDSKNPTKNVLSQTPDYRWGLFVDGNGIFARANSGNNLPTYNAQSGGVTTGLTYRWNDCFTTGLYAGYEGTYAKYNGGSSLIDNSVRFGLLATYGQKDGKGFYVDGLVGGGYNNYSVHRNIAFDGLNRTANSSPGAGELDTMLGGGYDFKKGNWTFGPMANAQFTYLAVNSFNETGAQSLDLNAAGWNTSSLLSTVGAHVAYTWMASRNIAVVPQINLGWQHEFMQNPYTINSTFNGTSPSFGNTSSTPIRDFLYTGVGFTVDIGKRWNTSLFYNASVGNSDLVSQNVFLSAGVNF